MANVDEVEKVFAEDGAMSTILKAKEAGLIKHIGITAHNEETAILALSKFGFETVMFPINWTLGFGDRLTKLCKEEQKGIIAIKALAHRRLQKDEAVLFPKSWTKPITNDDRLGICAIKHTLSRGADAIVPPGSFEHFCFAAKHIDECLANPLNDEDIRYLQDCLPSEDERFFIEKNQRRQTVENRA